MLKKAVTAFTFGLFLGGIVFAGFYIREQSISKRHQFPNVLPLSTIATSPTPMMQKVTFLTTFSLRQKGTTLPKPRRTVNLQIFNSQNDLVTSGLGKLTYDPAIKAYKGNIEIMTALESGNYTLKIQSDGYLRRVIPGKVEISRDKVIVLPEVSLVPGDLDGDNLLTVLDYNILLGCYDENRSETSCTNSQRSSSDFNGDGLINQSDYTLFLGQLPVQTGE